MSRRSSGDFFDDAELSYYCPYCGDYDAEAAFSATLVPALGDDEDAQEGPGFEPQPGGGYAEVTTDDAYALTANTLIVGAEVPGSGGTAINPGGPLGPTRIECDGKGECCEINDKEKDQSVSVPVTVSLTRAVGTSGPSGPTAPPTSGETDPTPPGTNTGSLSGTASIGVTYTTTVTSDDDIAWQIEAAREDFMALNREDLGQGAVAPPDIAIEEMDREPNPYYGGGLEVWITLPEVT